MPLALGGRIKSLEDIKFLFRSGADKVIINSEVYRNYELINEISNLFGKQSIIISVDVRRGNEIGEFTLYSECGKQKQDISLTEHIKKCELNEQAKYLSIALITMVWWEDMILIWLRQLKKFAIYLLSLVEVRVLHHMKEAFEKTNVAALACGSLFNFGDNNPIRAKSFLQNYNLNFKIVK